MQVWVSESGRRHCRPGWSGGTRGVPCGPAVREAEEGAGLDLAGNVRLQRVKMAEVAWWCVRAHLCQALQGV